MSEQEKNTEETIFDAAKVEFVEKGFDGTRMQEIAKRAGINKALLHYYYRTKEKLFDAIFEKVFNAFMPSVFEMMQSDAPLFYKIEVFISSYIKLISENPHIPSFILHELNRNPERLSGLFGSVMGVVRDKGFDRLSETIKKEIAEGKIVPIEPEHLITNIIAMCIFPVIARPIIQSIMFKNDRNLYNKFLETRATEVTKFVISSITIKKDN